MCVCLCAFSAFRQLQCRNLTTHVWGEIHLAYRAGNAKGQGMKRRILLQGSTQEAATRAWLRLAGSRSRYAGRLVPGARLSPATG